MSQTTHSGGCHCGGVRFEVDADLEATTILNCNCSICTQKGFLHLIVEPTDFRLLDGEALLSEYRFNSEIAVHRFCSRCGIHPFYTPRSHPDKVDVNVRCLDAIDTATLNIEHFDGRNWETNVDSIRDGEA